jgi:hypothetical protein
MTIQVPSAEFYGCIIFRSYITPPWYGSKIMGVVGNCKVVESQEVLGFRTNVRDSNWLVVVQGRVITMVIPGCEVLNFMSVKGPFPMDLNDEIVEVP